MRTTITIDPDVAERLSAFQRARGVSFKEAVNDALRRGLGATAPGDATPYRMPSRDLGLRPGVELDRVRQQLDELDDARFLDADADA